MAFLFTNNNNNKKDLETLRSESGTARNVPIEINLDIPLKVPMLC
jgi:hypothetical protein